MAKERAKLIRQNAGSIQAIINYTQKHLSLSRNLRDEESAILDFKRVCELGTASDLFVYEFDLEDVRHHLASAANTYSNLKLRHGLEAGFIDKMEMSMNGYVIQFLSNIDILW